MASIESRPLGQQALRGFGIFQAIVSVPTMVILGFFAWDRMTFPWEENYYYFLYVRRLPTDPFHQSFHAQMN